MLIDVKGQVTPVNSRSHITYSFDLRQPIGKLNIRFSYHPKRLEDPERSKEMILASIEKYSGLENSDLEQAKWESFLPLTNLITLSVDDPQGHRGAGHRHDPEQLIRLSEHQASPGFVSGPIIEGIWKVTLSLHGIVSELCSYELQIWQEEGL
ncbi:hypothetical protein EHS13_07500 [Paenibacillus psychroresistens]|uniref:Uncharacterized protein n=1 Tax=Paenibacillus psychroresistens TaxID=1778678 RepID=A0A6B8RFL8_9BACL|nr:hypothetical protein [Paenibacillus psychroresistens]QGQ94737.1 hypothetical protein EHS13_07500 [Paenibacillus psychroresistens]